MDRRVCEGQDQEVGNAIRCEVTVQVSVEGVRAAGMRQAITWHAAMESWSSWLYLRNALRRRHLVWLAAAVVAVLLFHAVSRVWSFEGTAVAASSEVAATANPEPRAFYARLAEPKDAGVLHGAGQLGDEDFGRYSAAVADSKPLLTASSVDIFDDLRAYFAQLRFQLERADESGGKQMLVPEIALSLNAGGWYPEQLQRLGTGKDGRRLAELAAGLRSLHRPVFLRIGPGSNNQENSYDPQKYAAAFRQVAQSVRAAGLREVAIVWEWSPDAELEAEAEGARAGDAAARRQAFYPGDDFVDWWGMPLYSEPAISSPATAAFLAEADRHGFPVMITEAMPKGHEVSEGALLVEDWFRPFFSLIARSRGIKAFSYLGRNWRSYPQWSNWGDTRLEADPDVLRYMRAQLRTPLFAGVSRKDTAEDLLRLTLSAGEQR